jgi:hypothetical protein
MSGLPMLTMTVVASAAVASAAVASAAVASAAAVKLVALALAVVVSAAGVSVGVGVCPFPCHDDHDVPKAGACGPKAGALQEVQVQPSTHVQKEKASSWS